MDWKRIVELSVRFASEYDPVVYSVDTYALEIIEHGQTSISPETRKILHAIFYGSHKEKDVLDAFIKNLYADKSGCVLRVDMPLFTVLAYVALFLLSEIGVESFKQLVLSQNPTKMYYFCSYVFDSNVLYSCLRADWLRVRDVAFIEKTIIASIEANEAPLRALCSELEAKALGPIDSPDKKVKATHKSSQVLTKPMSPRISKPRPRRTIQQTDDLLFDLPSSKHVSIPDFGTTTLASLEQAAQQRAESSKLATVSKYTDQSLGHFGESIDSSAVEQLRRELRDREDGELAFDSNYCNPVPAFDSMPAKIRINAAAVLREDALLKKQQAKDAELLRRYESELRDGFEHAAWQQEMRASDAKAVLNQVEFRRDQSKQSAEDARLAIQHAKEDNRVVADLLRDQARVIREQKELDDEVVVLKNRALALSVSEVRDTMPKKALERVLICREEAARLVREELEQARRRKEQEDLVIETERADRTRQLRALSSVHKKHVVVFDPTQLGGEVFLDEMSFLEMKERLAIERARVEMQESERRNEILAEQGARARLLEDKAEGIARARLARAKAKQQRRGARQEKELLDAREKQLRLQRSADKFAIELEDRRRARRAEAEMLRDEQERAARVVEFAGASTAMVDASRAQQLSLAVARQTAMMANDASRQARLAEETRRVDRINKRVHKRSNLEADKALAESREMELLRDKRECATEIREELLRKKALFLMGQSQHARTRDTIIEANPYAHNVSLKNAACAQAVLTSSSNWRLDKGRRTTSA